MSVREKIASRLTRAQNELTEAEIDKDFQNEEERDDAEHDAQGEEDEDEEGEPAPLLSERGSFPMPPRFPR